MNEPVRPASLDTMFRAVKRVHDNLLLAVQLLNSSGIPHAVCGSSAVYQWIESHEPSAVRYTKYAEFLVREQDVTRIIKLLSSGLRVAARTQAPRPNRTEVGIRWRPDVVLEMADGPLTDDGGHFSPSLQESELVGPFRVLSLRPLVRMKLVRYSRNDQVDIRDLIDVGLVDERWLSPLPDDLAGKLQHLLDTPDG
jgi:hypothetical protein